ncbi:Toluene efflux pump membrane transporter TtgB [Rhodopseudomonas palustris]|uniref:Efflux RND transporter permease subunit n=1 Tax=Rhodopseudomonas palustris (strain ATCC BAA-98 / CGA009) TaxID=258594 RepID=Q6N1J1_RHOPA|nr:efflux RND transporter permease subunit [Rhodopseudomonas palustris]OPF92204.1 multidrug transporter AcrB [Rhodopseudomonas palustris]QQM05981.1 Toluene efflux pump membrane transporter TtgB [Rhodopseudomonas palustris]RJF63525.1 efflux RND transporter permease subunit [Rhodopseudomonas palustris]WAB77305.1 efflux RND transporter permease subunit [Rhodopseudomonas palustris]WCL94611.1 efflux RND transporter permease subunit [Rhodopseudomonas palustris CGA009]
MRFNLSAWAVRHPALILFLICALGFTGIYSYQRLGRGEDPSFTVKVAVVSAIWPGATAKEMQEQVADPIEKKLQELPYFEKVQTYSKASFTAMQVTFRDSTPPSEVPHLFYLLRKKLWDVAPQLPSNLIGPSINDEYGDVDSILYMMTGDGASYAQLKKAAEGLRQRLLKVAGVSKVNIYGTQDEKIYVEFSHAKLATLGLTPQAIFDSLAKQNAVVPAGTVETSSQRVPLRVTGALDGAQAVAETPVESGGRVFRLGDVAEIRHGYVDPTDYQVRQKGKPAIGIGIVTAKGANILQLGEQVGAATTSFMADVPQGIEIEQIADQPEVVKHAVGEFMRSFVEALVIVLFVSFLALGWRTGIVVALSVPLVLAIVFIVMNVMAIDLHRITLGALIIALGLLVDDAIIAVEMMVVKMEQGWDRAKAASFAWESTAFPMLTGTLVTAAGFLPIGFANSGVGEYAGGIFWIVAIALIASWFVAVIFTPYIGVKLLPDFAGKKGHNPDEVYHTRIYRALRAAVTWCVRWRGTVVTATVGIFIAAVVGFGHVQQQFFPLSERPELFLQLRLPEGTAFDVTMKSVKEAETLLKDDGDIATYTAYVGKGSPRFWLGLNPQLPTESFAEIVVVAKDVAARERIKARIEQASHSGRLAAARVRVDRFNFGPPVGFPVQFRVIGPDTAKVREIAFQVRDVVKKNANVVDPHLDWNEQSPYLKLVVDQSRARALGLTPQDVSQALAMLISGAQVTTVRDGVEKIGVVARAVPNERLDLARIGELTITARNGMAVPLSQVAKVEYSHEEPILWRRNRDMAITVRGDVVDGVQAPDVTNAIWPQLESIRANLQPAYRIETGGAIEESTKGNASIFILFPVMVIAMLALLMIQLQSFPRLLLVFLTAPLGIIGASLGLNVASAPFGFVALLGLIALAGMIMRNAVILVDQIESDVAHGSTRREAIVEATVRRARPVVLTALAAILAMIPLSRSAFWGPMAITIMGGLFVATFLTLFYLPGLYALWFRNSLDERGKAEEPDLAPQHGGAAPNAFPLADAAE